MKTSEPRIQINGIILDDAQSMTVRVALNDFQISLNDSEIGEIEKKYIEKISEIQRIIQWNR